MIGIISDTHDNLPAIQKAVELFNERNVDLVLHAGDFVSPFTARAFKNLNAPIKAVFGNNDGDPVTLKKFFGNSADFFSGWARIEHNGKIIYLTHCPLPGPPLDCDLYVYGHTHEIVVKKESCLIVNPGECGGWLWGKQTVALVDLNLSEAEIIEL